MAPQDARILLDGKAGDILGVFKHCIVVYGTDFSPMEERMILPFSHIISVSLDEERRSKSLLTITHYPGINCCKEKNEVDSRTHRGETVIHLYNDPEIIETAQKITRFLAEMIQHRDAEYAARFESIKQKAAQNKQSAPMHN